MRKILNLSNIYIVIAFFFLVIACGAMESGLYITTLVFILMSGITAILALKEDGQIKK